MIKQLLHVSVRVSDLPRARKFYEEILGFTPATNRPNLSVQGMWYEFGGAQLHLLVSGEMLGQPMVSTHPGQEPHIAFAVESIEYVRQILQHAKIPFVLSRSGRKALFCRDPDGNVLELSEV